MQHALQVDRRLALQLHGPRHQHVIVAFAPFECERAAIEHDIAGRLGLEKTILPVKGVRKLTKRDMLHNDACPQIRVNPETFEVFIDGELATCEPASVLPLAQRYMLR